ncbi:MAG: hypothetical protein PQJ46_04160 [Spirochaetales bacterium]|nr:hypothetical protein [Spirochaetales bacterium]
MKNINTNRTIIILLLILFLTSQTFADSLEDNKKNITISLDAKLKTGIFGIPEGMSEQGNEAYIDLDKDEINYTTYGSNPRSGWDIVFTYAIKEVSMGPMGKHPVPYLVMKTNKHENASFSLSGETEKMLIEYEFEAGKMLKYNPPIENFFIKTTEGQTKIITFNDIKGKLKHNKLFELSFTCSD